MRFIIILFLGFHFLTHGQIIEKAQKLYADKQFDEAIKILKTVPGKDQQYADAQYYLGRIAFDKKQYEDAQSHFEKAIEINDNIADYHYWLGSTMGTIAQASNTFKQGLLAPKIKNEFEKTVKLDPQNARAHWGLLKFYTQAPGFMGGSWQKAEEAAKSIMKINKADGHNALGVVYQRQEKLSNAENQFVQAYQIDSRYRFTLANFYVNQKKYEKAFALFEDALKNDPDDMASAYQMGRTSAISGQRLVAGEEYLLRYLSYQPKENEPSHAGAKMRLGQIREKKGNMAEAKKNYEEALRMDPNLKEAKEGLERVK